jgi:hypothetical protein
MYLRAVKVEPRPGYDYRRVFVVSVLQHGLTRIDTEDGGSRNPDLRLREVFETRTYRYALVRTEPGVEFRDVARVLGEVSAAAYYVSIVTPAMAAQPHLDSANTERPSGLES